MELAAIPYEPSTGIEMTPTGVVFSGSGRPSLELVEKAIEHVGRLTRTSQFCLGDLINFAEHEFGSKYDEWMQLTGMTYQTLADISYVARNLPISLRNENLDYTQHRMIVSKVKTNEGRREWIETATALRLSSRELDASLKRGRVVTTIELQKEKENKGNIHDSRGSEPHSITLIKLTRWSEDMEAKHGAVDTWEFAIQAQLRQEFQALQQFCERLYA
jgi:hypothetical protein